MTRVRAVLALAVLAAFPVVLLAMFAGLAVAVVALVRAHETSGGVRLGLYVAVPLGAAVVAGVVQAARARPAPAEGVELGRHQHPRLWDEVVRLAAGLGTRPPERVVVVVDVNAAVSEVGGHRELVVGLPLLAGLTRAELGSVLGHELGHFGAGHTRLTAATGRAHALVVAVRQSAHGLAVPLLAPVAWLYLSLDASSRRDAEHEADDYSARLVGPATAARALRRVVDLDVAWSALTSGYGQVFHAGPARPPLHVGAVAVERAHVEEVRHLGDAVLAERSVPRYASHPPIGLRVERFERLVAGVPQRPDASGPARDLLGPPGEGTAVLEWLEGRLLADERPVGSWDDAARAAGEQQALAVAGQVSRAGQESGAVTAPTLGALLDAVRAGRGPRLVAPLADPGVAPEASGAHARELLGEALAQCISAGFVAAGLAHHRMSWTDGPELVLGTVDRPRLDDGGRTVTVDLDAVVGPVLDDWSRVDVLAGWLREHGVDLQAGARPAERGEPSLEAAMVCLSAGTKEVNLLVYPTGLAVVRIEHPLALKRLGQNATGSRAQHEATEVLALAERGFRAVQQHPSTRWLPSEQIAAARWRRSLAGPVLQLRFHDGSRLALRTSQHTTPIGPAPEAISALLGHRLEPQAWTAAGRKG